MLRRALLLLALVGCSAPGEPPPPPAAVDGVSTLESGVPCVPPSILSEPVGVLPVEPPPGAVLTDVAQQGGQRLITGRVVGSVEDVLEHFRSAPGYVVSRDEDEGRSGRLQLFGARGDVAVTVALLTCPRGSTGFTIATTVTGPSPGG